MVQNANLRESFFHTDYLPAINYGGAGSVIGHEMTHGFDTKGALFSSTGSYAPWWTSFAWANFRGLTNCFVLQYGTTVDPYTGIQVSVTLSLQMVLVYS